MPHTGGDGDPLWIRYVDWCSARVARRFLELTPDEIWERSEGASGARATVADLARALSVTLYHELALPRYAEWRALYEADPARFDAELSEG
jgi:hypothetical protein